MSREEEMTRDLLETFCALPSDFALYAQEPPRLAVGSPGKVGISRLKFEKFGDKTHLIESFNQMPARAHHPLYYDPHLPGMPYVFFVNPTGGIVQGDRYTYEFRLEVGAEAFITDSMATKIYKMDRNYASRHAEIYLGKNSRLEYLPKDIIPFAESRWYQNTVIHASDGSKMLFSEIFCPGRIAHDEYWDFSVFASKVMIEKGGVPIMIDSALYRKEDKKYMKTLFGDRVFLLSAYWYSEGLTEGKEQITFGDIYGGVTEMPYHSGIVVKALSNNLDELQKFQIDLWGIFRKVEVGTEAPFLRIY